MLPLKIPMTIFTLFWLHILTELDYMFNSTYFLSCTLWCYAVDPCGALGDLGTLPSNIKSCISPAIRLYFCYHYYKKILFNSCMYMYSCMRLEYSSKSNPIKILKVL